MIIPTCVSEIETCGSDYIHIPPPEEEGVVVLAAVPVVPM